MTDKQWDTVVELHNTVPFKLIRACAPYFRVTDGESRCVINISSTSGIHGNASVPLPNCQRPAKIMLTGDNSGQANYALAKAGVTGLTKTVAKVRSYIRHDRVLVLSRPVLGTIANVVDRSGDHSLEFVQTGKAYSLREPSALCCSMLMFPNNFPFTLS